MPHSQGSSQCQATDLPVIAQAAALLRSGKILAVKGIGGFHLFCDATAPEAVQRLRERKRRDRKPFAVLFADLAELAAHAEVDEAASLAFAVRPRRLCCSSAGPARRWPTTVAPGLWDAGSLPRLHAACIGP